MNRRRNGHARDAALPMLLQRPAGPALALVIPVYKHSVLLGEAVTSALDQETDFEFVVILVNDGCPMAETHQACLDFVAAAPDRVFYIRRPNGGLSAARNTGIEHVLGAWESVEAIYFLDADNRLLPCALQRAYDVLVEHPEVGWVYPNIDMFGQEWNSDYSGEYSVLRHLEENICEAGSLVRRAVFEQGARFDESMRLGFEDWGFLARRDQARLSRPTPGEFRVPLSQTAGKHAQQLRARPAGDRLVHNPETQGAVPF